MASQEKKYEKINYDALEKIRDGEAFASKYDSQQLRIRVPNVVMVFSNNPPAFGELAKLRLRVFYIEDNQLQKKSLVRSKDEEKKKDKDNADSDSDFHSQISYFDNL